jgi:nicotinate dehydrogenase subunit A
VAETTSFIVNGAPQASERDPGTPLLYVLRNDLGLKAARFGCGQGLCGACAILVDDVAVHACDTPLWSVSGKHVVTAEGLLEGDALGRVQQALVDERAGQCGYCLTGIVMRIEGALRAPAPATREGIIEALKRNLCRCGAHPRILKAVDRLLARQEAAR